MSDIEKGVECEQLSDGKIVMWDGLAEDINESTLVYEPHSERAKQLPERIG